MTDPLLLPAGVELDRRMALLDGYVWCKRYMRHSDDIAGRWLLKGSSNEADLRCTPEEIATVPIGSMENTPAYSTSTGTATELLERVCRERGWGARVQISAIPTDGTGAYICQIWPKDWPEKWLAHEGLSSLALAICRALLAATAAEVGKIDIPELQTPVAFGLEAQGHIPTIEKMLSGYGTSWNRIGEAIGWEPLTAFEHYQQYLAGKEVGT